VKSKALAQLVPKGQLCAYDLMVQVGLAMTLGSKQRQEVRAKLFDTRAIVVSTGLLSNLRDRFLAHLETLHRLKVPELRAAMNGGYPLHFDATSDSGKGGLFLCMDGWRDWVLLAARIDSESEKNIRPHLEKTVALFGLPNSTVRDLGDAGANAVTFLSQRGIADFVCHRHFLGAVGKKLFDKPYTRLRELLRRSALRKDLGALLKEARKECEAPYDKGSLGSGPMRKSLAGLLWWILHGDGRKEAVFPFALAHLDFVHRCRAALRQAETWIPRPRTKTEHKAIKRLGHLMSRLDKERRFAPTEKELQANWLAFSELRTVLRLTNAELPGGDARRDQLPLAAVEALRRDAIEKEVEKYRQDLKSRVVKVDRKERGCSAESIILGYLDNYGDKLFGHPVLRDADGAILAIVPRTNNPSEHFFGNSKQKLRRRVGRANLARDLQQQPAQVALAYNLRHSDYVQIVCGSLDNLATAFASLDPQAVVTSKLVRDHRDTELQSLVRLLLSQHKKDVDGSRKGRYSESQSCSVATVF